MIHNIRTISLLLWIVLFFKMNIIWTLLYPASSVLQLTGSFGVPVIDLPPPRRVFFDWGLQMNYDMPFNVSSFVNVPIWPTKRNITKRMTDIEYDEDRWHYYDIGLLDFYQQIETILENYGYHKTCLLHCICELAQISFAEDYMKLIGDILNFLGRPSLLMHHAIHQLNDLKVYLTAELKGYLNINCKEKYSKCDKSPLDVLTKIVID